MSVRAKFRVESATTFPGGHATIKLVPVTTGSEENKAFYKWTPGGSIDLQTVNHDVTKTLVPGGEFYVDFTPAT